MEHADRIPINRFAPLLKWIAVLAAVGAGFGIGMTADWLRHFQARALHLLGSVSAVYLPFVLALGISLIYLLVRYSEVTLGLFYLVGLFKSDPRLSSSPIDLTLVVAGLIAFSVLIRIVFFDQQPKLPKEYLFYLPLISMMLVSLLYTPSFDAGLDKTLRFVFLTCLGVFSACVLLDTPEQLRRFIFTIVLGGVIFAINSLTFLGGQARLVSPGGLNTGLGAATSVAIVVIWTMVFPNLSFTRRLLFYPVLGILVVATIGSGARFANIATCVGVVLSVLFCRKLIPDLAILGTLSFLAIPLVRIPEASYEYLRTLSDPYQAFGSRSPLVDWGIRLFAEHPFLGVGIEGYRFHTPNPFDYNFPHNLILELGAELGIIAVAAFIGLLVFSFLEILRQLRDPTFPYQSLARAVFVLWALSCLEASVSGEVGNRLTWFILGLPFLLRNFGTHKAKDIVETRHEFAPI